ncbi:MAG: hypothetical protein Q8P07_01240 [bacterium]|nr:hypothetical protein [bacterium]
MNQYLGLFKNPPWDFALVLTLIAGAFFWGASKGKRSVGFIIVNLYIMLALWPFFPVDVLTAGRTLTEIWAFNAGIFSLFLILLLLFMLRAFDWGGRDGVWWEVLILGVLAAGFFISILLSLAPPGALTKNILSLNPIVLSIFADPAIARWWTVLPILGVLFI